MMNCESNSDPLIVYADIISLPHHQSASRPHMSLHDRAAQFAPFAALSGYEEMVDEEARLTDREISLGDSDLDLLDRQFRRLSEMLSGGQLPRVTLLVFIPDPRKAGGRYETVTGRVRRLEPAEKKLFLLDDAVPPRQRCLEMDRILDLSFE